MPTAGKVFIDTNVWLYAFIRTQDVDKHKLAAALIEREASIAVSFQIINEVSVNLLKQNVADEAYIQELIQEWSGTYEVNSLSRAQLSEASRLRGNYNLSYWDSLIVAAALDARCDTLFTEDLQHNQVFRNTLRVVNPFLDVEQSKR